jgi:adhesin transport system outer membrane protein
LSLFPALVLAQGDGLAAVLRAATRENPLARTRIELIESLGQRVDEARSAKLPTLSLVGQSSVSNYNHGVFRVNQPLWAFGRIDGAIEVANRQLISGRASLLVARRQLIEDAAVTYVTLHGGRSRLAIAEQNVAEHEKLLALISRRMEGGVASEADMVFARSRLVQARSTRDQILGQMAKAKSDLDAVTLGDFPATEPVPQDLASLPSAIELLAIAKQNDAAVLQKMADLSVTETNARQRRLELLPTISLRVERDIAPNLPSGSTLNTARTGIYLETSLEGAGLTAWSRLKGEEARVRAARQDLESARNDVSRKVTGHLASLESLRTIRVSQEETTRATATTLASFLRQYDAGRKTWIDVLNTQKELADNRLALEQTRVSELELVLRLAAISGALDAVAQIQP